MSLAACSCCCWTLAYWSCWLSSCSLAAADCKLCMVGEGDTSALWSHLRLEVWSRGPHYPGKA